jgi:gliding motility-associated lipoprotein GldH
MRLYQFCSALLLMLLLTACGPEYIYEQTNQSPEAGWEYAGAENFEFNIEDTSQLYALHLIVEHDPMFFVQNFYVRLTTTFPDGSDLQEDLSLQLADKYGRWFGDCKAENCRLDIPIQPIAFFEQAGTYRVSIAQHTRANPLLGINAVGFAVEVLGERD